MVVAAFFALTGGLLLRAIDRAAIRVGRDEALVLGRTLSGSFASPLATGQHEVIQHQVDQIAELRDQYPDVVSIVVADQAGRIVAHSDPTRFGDFWNGHLPVREEMEDSVVDDGPVVVLRMPIETSVRFGSMELVVVTYHAWEMARLASRAVVAVLFLAVLLMVAVLSLLSHRFVVQPLVQLATAVSSYTVDRKTIGVPLSGPKEIRTLISAFDKMAARLHEYTGELEEKVEERTQALTEVNRQLQELAITDGLTGIANRRAFTHRITLEVERAQRDGLPLSLVMFDLDHFKQLNDTLGHLEGDAALVQLARILREGRRSADMVARYGGEEFVLLLPDTPHDAAMHVAELLRAATESVGLPARCTVSAGIATLPDQAEDARTLIAAADHALYAAKAAGRNRVASASLQYTRDQAGGA